MNKLGKLRRAGKWVTVLLGLLLFKSAWRCFVNVTNIFGAIPDAQLVAGYLCKAVSWGFGVALCAYAFVLLKALRDERTPFCAKNVKQLKVIALLLMVAEPLQRIANLFLLQHWVLSIKQMKDVNAALADSGFMYPDTVFIAGLAVWCIALVFEYGIELQKQADETL